MLGRPWWATACTQVGSMSVPPQTIRWTCGIAVKGDYACGGGTPSAPSAPGSRGWCSLSALLFGRVHVVIDSGHLRRSADGMLSMLGGSILASGPFLAPWIRLLADMPSTS